LQEQILQRTKKSNATNTWLQEQMSQRTKKPNATNTWLQEQILQRTKKNLMQPILGWKDKYCND
jgi:hypothetical protein